MNHGLGFKGRLILIAGALAFLLGCAGQTVKDTGALTPHPESTQENDMERAKEVLNKAFERATATGSAAVELDLDEDPERVQRADLVRVYYTASLENGKISYTNRAKVAKDEARPKVAWYEEPSTGYGPEEVLAGSAAYVPGVGEAILGMAAGDKKTVTLPAEKAYGLPDPQKMIHLPCIKRLPMNVRMHPEEFVREFGSFPLLGKELEFNPYLKARVSGVTEYETILELLARDGERVLASFGTAEINVDIGKKEVTIRLTPTMGAPFEVKGREGRIVSTDGSFFTVDFNHPMAGKSVVIDLEIVSLAKASSLRAVEIPWLYDHEQGLDAARQEGKPAVLVLYASWCQWSQKLLSEVFEDPRIKSLKDRFIWVQIDSDEEGDLKALYEQDGFPMVVLLGPRGEVVDKLDGFREVGTLREELEKCYKQVVGT